jgi:hypothetical protein
MPIGIRRSCLTINPEVKNLASLSHYVQGVYPGAWFNIYKKKAAQLAKKNLGQWISTLTRIGDR